MHTNAADRSYMLYWSYFIYVIYGFVSVWHVDMHSFKLTFEIKEIDVVWLAVSLGLHIVLI